VLERVRRKSPFELHIVDIESAGNETWFEAYKEDIPVVHIDGHEVCRHRVDERQFLRMLNK